MIPLYQDALARAPQDLALAFALGRVYFELEMLDEAADQFQKVEVRTPDFPPLHAYLGAIFERRGQGADAFQEYRRALTLTQSFEWPHRCSACGLAPARYCRPGGPPSPAFAPGRPAEGSPCELCRRRRPPFAYARAAAVYGERVREAVHALKFEGKTALARPLGD